MKVAVYKDGVLVRRVMPRDDAGHMKSSCNEDDRARRAADIGCEALGLARWARSIHIWNAQWTPTAVQVAETVAEAVVLGRRLDRRVGSNDGRKAPIIDFITPAGAGVNLKFTTAAGHAAVIVTTAADTTAAAQVAEISAAPIWTLQVQAVKINEDYIIDLANLRWHLTNASAAIRAEGGTLSALAARKRGRGRPTKGAQLPRAWATHAQTTCTGGSWKIQVRGLELEETGWQTGNIEDLHRALLAL